MSLPKDLRELVGGILGLALASGYAMSVQVRCISWLLIPTFFGKKGRSFVGAYAIMFLISGIGSFTLTFPAESGGLYSPT